MSAGFTPGPWAYRIYGDSEMGDPFHLGQQDDENGGIYGTILEGGLVLASDDENEANARLIAAAPELYEALEDLLSETCDEWASEDLLRRLGKAGTFVKAVSRGRRALAKARGEQVSA